jgi:diguanylate cyclase (GGDEF)-like protein/PAS domain S-box-containing protein
MAGEPADSQPDEARFLGRAAQFFRGSSDLFAIADLDYVLIQVNQAWEDTLGWTAAELTGRPFADFVHPDDRIRSVEEADRVLSRRCSRFLNRYRTKDGGYRWLDWSADVDTEAGLIYARAHDVTVRVEAQQGLLDSERLHRLLVGNLPDISLMIFGRDLRCTYMGGGQPASMGYDMNAFVGQPVARLSKAFGGQGPHLRALCEAALEGDESKGELFDAASGQYHTVVFLPFRNDETEEIEGIIVVATNVTKQRSLSRQAEELAKLVSVAGEAILSSSLEGHVLSANDAACRLYGFEQAELVGMHAASLLPSDVDEAQLRNYHATVGRGEEWRGEMVRMRKDGSRIDVQAVLTPMRDEAGRITGIAAVLHDVTGQRAAERELRKANQLFRLSFDHAPIGKALAAFDGGWGQANQAMCAMLGYDEQTLVSAPISQLLHADDWRSFRRQASAALESGLTGFDCETRWYRSDGTMIWCLLSITFLLDENGPDCYLVHMQDITARRTLEENLRSQAELDPLTGVLNRRGFDEVLAASIGAHVRAGETAALLFLDLNGFKDVNDTYGHQAGDEVLRAVAQRLRSRLRTTDVLGRMGGDEFAVLLEHIGDAEADRVAAALVQTLRDAVFDVAGTAVTVGASIGIARLGTGGAGSAAEALAAADEAMYQAKRGVKEPVES